MKTPKKNVDEAKRKQKEFSKLHSSSVVLHAPYSCSETLIQLVDDLSANHITTIHNQESDEENKLFQYGDGNFLKLFEQLGYKNKLPLTNKRKRSIQYYFTKFKHQQHILLVHNTYTNEEDLRYIQTLSKDIYWCLCVNANLYIENRLPDIALLHQSGVPIILGTDSLASNTNLSILEEIKTIQQFYPSIPIADILHWATLQGAKALGLTDKFGSFLKGKKPGVLNIANFNLLHGINKTAMVRRLW
jgi:cytosine/adenosine deaminase-related metal-dependent hydrolase